jgi:hypothetical protein
MLVPVSTTVPPMNRTSQRLGGQTGRSSCLIKMEMVVGSVARLNIMQSISTNVGKFPALFRPKGTKLESVLSISCNGFGAIYGTGI